MDIAKTPPLDSAASRAATTTAEQGAQAPVASAAIADRADIRPLDIPSALQILLSELRAALGLEMGLASDGAALESPVQAAQVLVRMVLQSMPDEAPDVAAWTQALARMETALQTGFASAISAVSAWRDVPPAVVDAAKETRALVFSVLGDAPQNPLWLRPEWVGLAPRLQRFWRRRRLARRRLMDPDYSSGGAWHSDEQR
jgi:hypothetical protein